MFPQVWSHADKLEIFARRVSTGAVWAVLVAIPLVLFVSAEAVRHERWAGYRGLEYWQSLGTAGPAGAFGTGRSAGMVIQTQMRDEGDSYFVRKGRWKPRRRRLQVRRKKLETGTPRASRKPAPGSAPAATSLFGNLSRTGLLTTRPARTLLTPATTRRESSANRAGSGRYRTVCVRLCDGYFWPVSFSTSAANLAGDAGVCRASCGSPARLYYYENPGSDISTMVDLKGRSYDDLANAWRYRAEYVPSCKCQPHPWEQASLARHRKYAVLKKQGRLKRYLKRLARVTRKVRRRARKHRVAVWTPRNSNRSSGYRRGRDGRVYFNVGSIGGTGRTTAPRKPRTATGRAATARTSPKYVRKAPARAPKKTKAWNKNWQAMRVTARKSRRGVVRTAHVRRPPSRSRKRRKAWHKQVFSAER